MSATNRRKPAVYGSNTVKKEEQIVAPPLPSLANYHVARTIPDKPANIVRYLIAVQVREFGESILSDDLNRYVLQRHAKYLLKKYTAQQICCAIVDAVRVANHPFSFKFVEKFIS